MEVIDLFRGPTPSLATSRAIVHCRGGEVALGPGRQSATIRRNLTISSPHKHAADLAAVVSPHLGTGPHLGTTRGSRGHGSRVCMEIFCLNLCAVSFSHEH